MAAASNLMSISFASSATSSFSASNSSPSFPAIVFAAAIDCSKLWLSRVASFSTPDNVIETTGKVFDKFCSLVEEYQILAEFLCRTCGHIYRTSDFIYIY